MKKGLIVYPFEACKITKFMEENKFSILRNIMTVITVHKISQENICCLNTSIIFFIFANRRCQVSQYFNILEKENNMLINEIRSNFKSLLQFWQDYYSIRGRDCVSLEYSSHINFTEWLQTFTILSKELDMIVNDNIFDIFKEQIYGEKLRVQNAVNKDIKYI